MGRLRTTLAAVLLLVGLCGGALGSVVVSAAGRAEFQRLRWKGRTVRIDISSSLTRPNTNIKYGSDVAGAIQRSVEAWQAAADIQLVTEPSDKQSVSPSGVTGDGTTLITIAQTPENVLFFAKDSDSASAKTRIFFNRSGYITEADIVLNPFQQFSTDGTFGTFDLESTLTHEIGHLLGLRHSGVLGATMADSFARIGTFGVADLSPRTLAETDITAIRDLYGPPPGTDCCAVVNGKLLLPPNALTKPLRIWAEEDRTGRVIAETDANADGTFALGGLLPGSYALFWKTSDAAASTSVGQLGNVKLQPGESKTLSAKIALRTEDLSTQYVGLNSQIADFGIPLTAGRSLVVYVGGRNLDARTASIEFNSPYLTVSPNSAANEDFDKSVSVISFIVNVHPNTPPGEYSIFLAGDDGLRACLIGGLSVE
jgi:Matrixin